MAEQLAELNKGDLEVYSTTEKKIGTWTDGKPIYRSIFSGTLSSGDTNISISSLNVDSIVDVYGGCFDPNNAWTPYSYYYSSTYYNQIYINSSRTNLVLTHGSGTYTGKAYKVIFEYTKTTD